MELGPILLSVQLGLATAFLLLCVGLPLSVLMHQYSGFWITFVRSLVTLPILLPPTVIGFYFLVIFNPEGAAGSVLKSFDIEFVFSFPGLVLACAFYSLPFMLQPLLQGLEMIPKELLLLAQSFQKTKWQIFWQVKLPLLQSAVLNGIIMSFAHTMGAFGVVLMVGGSIPGETRVASVAIYEEVQAMNYATAHTYAFIFVLTSILIIFGARLIERKQNFRNKAAYDA